MAEYAPIACPDCGGKMYNNIGSKKNPKQPDYKCKDKESCGKGVWLKDSEKESAKTPAAPVVPPTEEEIKAAAEKAKVERTERIRLLFSLRKLCVERILTVENPSMATGGVDPLASTTDRINNLFDNAVREGLAR